MKLLNLNKYRLSMLKSPFAFDGAFAAFFIVILAYTFAETRHPALNYDDTYWIGTRFPNIDRGNFIDGLYYMMFQHNLGANEFRTFGLSKVFHFGMYKIFGTAMLPYYFVMAAMSVLTVMFAAAVAKSVTGSIAVSIALAGCCLLGPFMLFQTFHHATYILLPLLLITAYLALDVKIQTGVKRKLSGALLCVLVVMTGEVATFILLVALGLMFLSALQRGNKAYAYILLTDLLAALATLALLYGYYRAFIYDANLAMRFSSPNQLTLRAVLAALVGFNTKLASLTFSSDYTILFAAGTVFDWNVVAALVVAALVVAIAIFISADELLKVDYRPVFFMLVLYITSFSIYVLVAAQAGVAGYATRYLQVSGLFFIGWLCIAAAVLPVLPRKILLSAIVVFAAAGGALTYGVKVTTLEAVHDQLTASVLAEKARGGQKVVFLTRPEDAGLMTPSKFFPATTPLQDWWILDGYCKVVWGLKCAPGISEQLGDIVVEPNNKYDGWLSRISVRAGIECADLVSCRYGEAFPENENFDVNFFITDSNWIHGIARNWAGFIVPNTPTFARQYKAEKLVLFPGGESREIKQVIPSGKYLNIYLNGNPLAPEKVGLPTKFVVMENAGQNPEGVNK